MITILEQVCVSQRHEATDIIESMFKSSVSNSRAEGSWALHPDQMMVIMLHSKIYNDFETQASPVQESDPTWRQS